MAQSTTQRLLPSPPAAAAAPAFWSLAPEDALRQLGSGPAGLSAVEAGRRLAASRAARAEGHREATRLALFLRQFTSPIVLLLLAAAGLSFGLGDRVDAGIILAIVAASGGLGYWQEYAASDAVAKLLRIVQLEATLRRDGREVNVPVADVVAGDIVILNAGDIIPGDCLLLEAKDLFVDESVLTGETFPVEKLPGRVPPEAPLAQRSNTLFMGTHVISGSAAALVAQTGAQTEFGKVSGRLRLRPPETEFERGIRQFGYLLLETTLLLVLLIFAGNVFLKRPVLDSFLFSLALAVGLTPQLLPAIVSVNLAHGAKEMGKRKVIVKRLASIENIGSMDVLCSDKTGTLTEGQPRLKAALDPTGVESENVLLAACMNAAHQTGFANPIDQAICAAAPAGAPRGERLDEVPYDFIRKRLTVLVNVDGTHRMITKGALASVLEVCDSAAGPDGSRLAIEAVRGTLRQRFEALSGEGYRVLGIAERDLGQQAAISKSDETGMTFLGFLVFFDPPKAGVAATVERLRQLGVALKIITGDNQVVARSTCRQLAITAPAVLTGPALHQLSDAALLQQAPRTDIFAEVEPNQKERIILALRKAGGVVGYLGDGINDAPALHAADVGISVESAVDVAREAATIVLLEKDLDVLAEGVVEGRKTFANTLKYVFMATSANFGNMFSMAGASLLLPFLPLLPKQILLTNLLTDIPEMAISTDAVDEEWLRQPRRWDVGFIRRFMLAFGLLSSVFDYLTFGALLLLLHANAAHFRTGWFQESVISAVLIVLVVRTRRPFWKSRPSTYLAAATAGIVIVVMALPWLPVAPALGLQPLPLEFPLMLTGIVGTYVIAAEIAKRLFYRPER
jgi:Mg2+-importing ATPase